MTLYLHRAICSECGYTTLTDAPLAMVEPGCGVCAHELPHWEPVSMVDSLVVTELRAELAGVRARLEHERTSADLRLRAELARAVRGTQ